MKTLIAILLFFGFTMSSYSQEPAVKDEGSMELNKLPEVVIHKAEKDFSDYIRHDNPDEDVRKVQDEFIAYNIGKDYLGHDEYLLVLKRKIGSLIATYNENGKLTRVVENYKDVSLPMNVKIAIYKSYPQWLVIDDKLTYVQSEGKILKNEYNLKIKKDKKVKTLVVNPNGDIIKE